MKYFKDGTLNECITFYNVLNLRLVNFFKPHFFEKKKSLIISGTWFVLYTLSNLQGEIVHGTGHVAYIFLLIFFLRLLLYNGS